MWRTLTPWGRPSPAGRLLAFSLVELVVVIVIIGILAAIAIPRLSRGSAAATDSALLADLNRLRSAITTFAIEHNNVFPGSKGQDVAKQLTLYTDLAGEPADARTTTYRFGPYLSAIPPCPVGDNADKPTANAILISTVSPPKPVPESGEGWVYNATTGELLPNTSKLNESDAQSIGDEVSEGSPVVKH